LAIHADGASGRPVLFLVVYTYTRRIKAASRGSKKEGELSRVAEC
jgi:hypothetical protein